MIHVGRNRVLTIPSHFRKPQRGVLYIQKWWFARPDGFEPSRYSEGCPSNVGFLTMPSSASTFAMFQLLPGDASKAYGIQLQLAGLFGTRSSFRALQKAGSSKNLGRVAGFNVLLKLNLQDEEKVYWYIEFSKPWSPKVDFGYRPLVVSKCESKTSHRSNLWIIWPCYKIPGLLSFDPGTGTNVDILVAI